MLSHLNYFLLIFDVFFFRNKEEYLVSLKTSEKDSCYIDELTEYFVYLLYVDVKQRCEEYF